MYEEGVSDGLQFPSISCNPPEPAPNGDKITGIWNLPTLSPGSDDCLCNICSEAGIAFDDRHSPGSRILLGSSSEQLICKGLIHDPREVSSCGCLVTHFSESSGSTDGTLRARSEFGTGQTTFDYTSHSIESFYGRIDDLEGLFKLLNERYAKGENQYDGNGNSMKNCLINPESVRKILFVGNPLITLRGMNRFIRLTEVWVTDCDIKELLRSDVEGLSIHKLFLYNNRIEKIESLPLEALRVLWLNGNRIQSLDFLTEGLPVLEELNVAQNMISSLMMTDFLKCPLLHTVNISGNPLTSLQDLIAIKTISSLRVLYLADPVYGKCPVASHCDSRAMILSVLDHIITLDGKNLTPEELADVNEYVVSRGLYYFAHSIRVVANQSVFRSSSILSTIRKLDAVGQRFGILLSLVCQYRRIISNVQVIPIFTNAKSLMREQVEKIEQRMGKLIGWAGMTIRRLRTVMEISRWEQDAEKWIKWVEYQSYGNTQCHMLHSVHAPRVVQLNELCVTLHELISSLSCSGLWPQGKVTKMETIIVVRDLGMESSLQRTFEELYAPNSEPQFIPSEDMTMNPRPTTSNGGTTFPNISKPATTYMNPDFKPRRPVYPYPDSIVGFPEKAHPVFLFLTCPSSFAANPLAYFYKIMDDKAIHYKGIRLTNCMWHALRKKSASFAILIVVKVLPQALQLIRACRNDSADNLTNLKHGMDCGSFSVRQPAALSPVYILTVSFTQEEEKTLWKVGSQADDGDVVGPAKSALATLTDKIVRHGHLDPIRAGQNRKNQFIRKSCEGGFVGDFSCTLPYMTKDGQMENSTIEGSEEETWQPPIDSIAKFFGAEVAVTLTVLDLCGNKLGHLIGLEGLQNLKKLKLSHNKLTEITNFSKFPSLVELKLGWNKLRHLHGTGLILRNATPHLTTLEILPNPFQDVRELSHCSVILKRLLPFLSRLDSWIGSPKRSPEIPFFNPVTESTFDSMADCWGSHDRFCEMASKCLTNLDSMPLIPEGHETDGIELNISDNYLTSNALHQAAFVTNQEWRMILIKLELQENNISTMCWMNDRPFPNLQILNVANNWLTGLHDISPACPELKHLIVCGNPIPRDSGALAALKPLGNLKTLDCTGAPITTHPLYSNYVVKNLTSVKILDGIPMVKWQILSQVESIGGQMKNDWLEDKLGLGIRDWTSLTQVSMPNLNLQQITLPGSVFPHLITLNLQGNRLTTLTSLSTLPALKVLCLSHNKVSTLGSQPCPICYSNTVQSQLAIANWHKPFSETSSSNYGVSGRKPKPMFPKLEVLILSHNDLSSVNDLHLHAMPKLQTVLCNCNLITNFNGFDDSPTIKVIVLDNNKIRDVPLNCLVGCNSLRYLHMAHNRLTALPRTPHLPNLSALHIGYNKIQSLTDLSCLARITDLSLEGNPAARYTTEYRFKVASTLPLLNTLDGRSVFGEMQRTPEQAQSFSGAGRIDQPRLDYPSRAMPQERSATKGKKKTGKTRSRLTSSSVKRSK